MPPQTILENYDNPQYLQAAALFLGNLSKIWKKDVMTKTCSSSKSIPRNSLASVARDTFFRKQGCLLECYLQYHQKWE